MRRASRLLALAAVCSLVAATPASAQNRGKYPLGQSALNSGVTPRSGFTYSNLLLFYSRDESKDDNGNTIATGSDVVLMDINSFAWVSSTKVLWGARYSVVATLPVATKSLTSDITGSIGSGAGLADSYHMPFVLGWDGERSAFRLMYGFVAPTGRYEPGAKDNVGSGYWMHGPSAGQTFHLNTSKSVSFSAYEIYEFHTVQEGTGVRPGQTLNVDYSLMSTLPATETLQIRLGVVGYEARQTTANTGPDVTSTGVEARYAVNAFGVAASAAFPIQKIALSLRYFDEFANRSTYEGYSVQVTGAISF